MEIGREVEFPHPLISEKWRQGVSLHEAALFLQEKLLKELSVAELDLENLIPVCRGDSVARLSCLWYERTLRSGPWKGSQPWFARLPQES